jgi:hypothetical protein
VGIATWIQEQADRTQIAVGSTSSDPPAYHTVGGTRMTAADTIEQLERDHDLRLSTAETAECQCPEFCERDHDRD